MTEKNRFTSEYYNAVRKQNGEKNSCAVQAISEVTQTPFEEVLCLLSSLGRDTGRGVRISIIEKTLDIMGYDIFKINVKSKTSRSFNREVQSMPGAYMVFFKRHVAGWYNGVSNDWVVTQKTRSGRQSCCKRIIEVCKIVKRN